MDALGWPHLLIIFAVIILLFGAAKLPGVAKALGQSMRVFKNEMAQSKQEDAAADTARAVAAAPPGQPGVSAPAPPSEATAPRPSDTAPHA